jgi:hypothetical protein
VLSSESERRKYDRLREEYNKDGFIDPKDIWDEEFHANASGSETSQSEAEEDPTPVPDKNITKIYEKATPSVNEYLSDPTEENKAEVEKFNQRIREENKRQDRRQEMFEIRLGLLEGASIEARKAMKKLAGKTDDKNSLKMLEGAERTFAAAKRNMYYPALWKLDIPPELEKKIEQLRWAAKKKDKNGEPSSSNRRARGEKYSKNKGKERDEESSSLKDEGKRRESSNGKGKGKERDGGGESSKARREESDGSKMDWEPSKESNGENTPQSSSQVSKRRGWKPGETKEGDRIIGYRPFLQTDIKTLKQQCHGVNFVIEKKDKLNPIALVAGQDVGRRVTRAYLNLPDSEKNDIRYSEKKYSIEDIDNFGEILGFASKPFRYKSIDSNRLYPDGYALVRMKDGEEHLMSRQAIRKILGQKEADDEIAEFYDDIGKTPPWKIKTLAWRDSRQKVGTEMTRRRRSHRRSLLSSDSSSDSNSGDSSDSDVSTKSDRVMDSEDSYRRVKSPKQLRRERQTQRKRSKNKRAHHRRQIEENVEMDDVNKYIEQVIERTLNKALPGMMSKMSKLAIKA